MWATAAFCSCPHIHDPLAHAGSRGMPDPFYRKKVAQSLPDEVLRLAPLVTGFPEDEQEARAAMVAEGFLRACLRPPLPPADLEDISDLIRLWSHWIFPLFDVFRIDADGNLLASGETLQQVVTEGIRSDVETERVGGVFLAAAAQKWDDVANLAADANRVVRRAVVIASHFFPGDDESTQLIEILEMLSHDPDDLIGRFAIHCLSGYDHPAATDFLIRLVEGEDRALAQRASTELRRAAHEELVLRLWHRVHAGFGGEETRQLALDLMAEQADYLQDAGFDPLGELFLAWAMPDFSVDTEWILAVIDDVGAVIIDWWEGESKYPNTLDLSGIARIICAEPGSRVYIRTARSSSSVPAAYDLFYEMMRGLLVVDHFRPIAAADLALSAMIQSHPKLLVDLALPRFDGPQWSCSVVVAGLAWRKIESLLSAPGAIIAAMPGMRNVIDRDEMRAALRDQVPASLITAWHTFDLPKPSFIEGEDGETSY